MQTKTLTNQINQRLWTAVIGVLFFTALTALSARFTFEIGPVPITLQTLAVVLSGLVLGARGGALSQVAYIGLIASGLPLDARGLGPAVFFSPTAGYLLGFVAAAFVTGQLAERYSIRSWWGNFVAAMIGIVVLFAFGTTWLAVYLGSWQQAWLVGVVPFIFADMVKAIIAASVAESGKYWLNKQY